MGKKKSNYFYWFGASLMIIGLIIGLSVWVSYLFFGCGAILVLASSKHWTAKNTVVFPILTYILFNLIYESTAEIYLVPSGYIGPIVVAVDKDHGKEKEFDGFKKIYRIPETGVLFTKFELRYRDWGKREFYYQDVNGKREIIPEYSISEFGEATSLSTPLFEPPRDSIAAFKSVDKGILRGKYSSKDMEYRLFIIDAFSNIGYTGYNIQEQVDTQERIDYLNEEKSKKNK